MDVGRVGLEREKEKGVDLEALLRSEVRSRSRRERCHFAPIDMRMDLRRERERERRSGSQG